MAGKPAGGSGEAMSLHFDVADEEAAARAAGNASRIIGEWIAATVGPDRTLLVEARVLERNRRGVGGG